MQTPLIRQATADDIPALIQLYTEFHYFHVLGVPDRLRLPPDPPDNTLPNILRELLQRPDAVIFVAEVERAVVGLAEVYFHQDTEHSLTIAHCYGHLQSLIVSTPFRKLGLGKLLVSASHQWAKEHGATEMQLDIWEFPAGPLHFYEKLGYRTLKRHLVTDLP